MGSQISGIFRSDSMESCGDCENAINFLTDQAGSDTSLGTGRKKSSTICYANREDALAKGAEYAEAQDYSQALQAYMFALSFRPHINSMTGNYGVLKVQPTKEDAHIYDQIGQAYYALKQLGSAVDAYEAAMSLDPTNPELPYRKGVIHQTAGDAHNAMKSFEQSLVIDKEYVPSLFNMGLLMVEMNRPDEARSYLIRLLKVDEDHTEAMVLMADTFSLEGRYEQAKPFLKHALLLDPTNFSIKRNLTNMTAAATRSNSCVDIQMTNFTRPSVLSQEI